MLLSAVSVLVVAQSIFEILEGLMNNPVYGTLFWILNGNFVLTLLGSCCLESSEGYGKAILKGIVGRYVLMTCTELN